MKRALLGTIAMAALTGSAAAAPKAETAVLAGGCFWGMESVFEHVKGVTDVVSGFAGGVAKDADYEKVSTEGTGHAEAVKITYDPSRISYAQLLQIYFTVAHDPTEVNRQGPDVGPSYRSAVFPQNSDQARLAKAFCSGRPRPQPLDRHVPQHIVELDGAAFGREHQDIQHFPQLLEVSPPRQRRQQRQRFAAE